MKFLSNEMLDEMMKRAEEDPELPERLRELTIRLLMVGTDCPGGNIRLLLQMGSLSV